MRANSEKSQRKSVLLVPGFGKAYDGKPRAKANMKERASVTVEVSGYEVQQLLVTCYTNLEPEKFNERLQEIDRELGLLAEQGSKPEVTHDVP